nr:stromal 70 kDa heat shock-related protein, chloroplastic-like [Tanacetum cinerariifolium]
MQLGQSLYNQPGARGVGPSPSDALGAESTESSGKGSEGESPKTGMFFVHPRSAVSRIKERKCIMRGGSLRPSVKRKLAFGSSSSRTVRARNSASKDDAFILSISNDDEDLRYHSTILERPFGNQMDLELLDLHDRYYAQQAVVDMQLTRGPVSFCRLQSTNGSFNWLNNGFRIWYLGFNLDNQRLDLFGASFISRRHRVLCHLGFTFHYFRRRRGSRNRGSLICISTSSGDTLQIFLQSQLAVKESGVDEPELGNPGLNKMVLDKLESQLAVEESGLDEPKLGNLGLDKLEAVLILIASVLILIKPWWSEIIVQTIAKQIMVTLRTFMRFLLISAISVLSAIISGSEEEVMELDDSLL